MPCERVDYYSDEEFQSALIAEEQAWDEHQQEQQEPDIVPCFDCGNQMYHESHEPKENICEECKSKKGNTMETKKPEEQPAELQKVEPQEIQKADESPFAIMVDLMSQGAEINTDTMREMFLIRKDYKAEEARKAYHAAMAAFKLNPPNIIKDKHNTQYNSKYASLANVTNTVNAKLSEHGLSSNWKVGQKENGWPEVTCIITHAQGHSEQTTLSAPPDESGKKNPIQQIKSTLTYLEQMTLLAMTGLATDDVTDDDGNGAYPTPKTPVFKPITAEEFEVLDAICEKLQPAGPGFVINKKRIGSLLLERNRAGLVMDNVEKAAAWVMTFGDHDIYEPINPDAEIPGEFE